MAMQLDLGLLADDAIAGEMGKLYIFGEFRYIFVPALPARHGRFAIIARFVANAVEVRGQNHVVQIEVVDQDGTPTGLPEPRTPEIPITFLPIGPANLAKHQAIF